MNRRELMTASVGTLAGLAAIDFTQSADAQAPNRELVCAIVKMMNQGSYATYYAVVHPGCTTPRMLIGPPNIMPLTCNGGSQCISREPGRGDDLSFANNLDLDGCGKTVNFAEVSGVQVNRMGDYKLEKKNTITKGKDNDPKNPPVEIIVRLREILVNPSKMDPPQKDKARILYLAQEIDAIEFNEQPFGKTLTVSKVKDDGHHFRITADDGTNRTEFTLLARTR